MKQIITQITDDIDGTPDATTVTFSYAGKSYTIDLGAKNADKLAKALEPFIAKATELTKAPKEPGVKKIRKSNAPAYDKAAFRAWAEANGKWTGARPAIATIQEFLSK